jgi:hypothetical protein
MRVPGSVRRFFNRVGNGLPKLLRGDITVRQIAENLLDSAVARTPVRLRRLLLDDQYRQLLEDLPKLREERLALDAPAGDHAPAADRSREAWEEVSGLVAAKWAAALHRPEEPAVAVAEVGQHENAA